jgi:hypothetical protein
MKSASLLMLAIMASLSAQRTTATEAIALTGVVTEVCVACANAHFQDGRVVEWDIVSVELASPASFSGKTLSLQVLVENAGDAQRAIYSAQSSVAFQADPEEIDAGRVMLESAGIRRSD